MKHYFREFSVLYACFHIVQIACATPHHECAFDVNDAETLIAYSTTSSNACTITDWSGHIKHANAFEGAFPTFLSNGDLAAVKEGEVVIYGKEGATHRVLQHSGFVTTCAAGEDGRSVLFGSGTLAPTSFGGKKVINNHIYRFDGMKTSVVNSNRFRASAISPGCESKGYIWFVGKISEDQNDFAVYRLSSGRIQRTDALPITGDVVAVASARDTRRLAIVKRSADYDSYSVFSTDSNGRHGKLLAVLKNRVVQVKFSKRRESLFVLVDELGGNRLRIVEIALRDGHQIRTILIGQS